MESQETTPKKEPTKYKRYLFKRIIHLAGVVPVGGKPLDFKMPWHDSLIPVAPDYLAIERAIYECALAGCDTIWVVAHKGYTPLIRKRIGDFISDPVSLNSIISPIINRRDIPIYYVPISPKDQEVRDCLSWSALYGAEMAYRVCYFISKWIQPKRFYCAFPYGITPDKTIRENRNILKKERNVIFSHNGKSVKDGLHMSFVFDFYDYKICRDIVKKRNIKDLKERAKIDATNFSILDVFSHLDLQDCLMVELPWFYDISSWEGYRNFLASQEAATVVKNKYVFINNQRRNFRNYEDEKEYDYESESRTDLQQPTNSDEREDESS
jgi:hypothetical protein